MGLNIAVVVGQRMDCKPVRNNSILFTASREKNMEVGGWVIRGRLISVLKMSSTLIASTKDTKIMRALASNG